MNQRSDAVKLWRDNTKKRIVGAMGGKCCVCGYNKCMRSLALHHIDPSKKEISFGAIRANPKSWETIVIELRKCVLLCTNCHGELHDGLISVEHPIEFDETYCNYIADKMSNNLEPCPICGNNKPKWNRTCSRKCASTLSGTVKWGDVDLEKELSEKTYCQIGRELGCSDNAVRKRAKKLNLI